MKLPITTVKKGIIEIFSNHFSSEQAEKIAEVLIWADMSGIDTQGLIKLTGTEPMQNIKPKHEIRIERNEKVAILINAGANPAPLVCQQATDLVIQKAKELGVGMVGVHNTFSSNGAQAFYAERIAKKNLIGIVASRSPAAVAPFNSIDPVFGTNPIGFSFPTDDEPIIFDMATSALTWYGLVQAKARGEKIPESVAVDSTGQLTIDPAEAMNGALLPFDRGYKGSGLGMVVELLAGPLVGAGYGDLESEWGTFIIAIDPNLFGDIKAFKKSASQLIKIIRGSRSKDGQPIRIPGDQARKMYKESESTGLVEVDEKVAAFLGLG